MLENCREKGGGIVRGILGLGDDNFGLNGG